MTFRTAVIAVLACCTVVSADEGVFTTRPNARQELVPLPKEEGVFHFVIYGDRTGGPAEGIKILRQAVRDTNLLDPDLVMTVGDLVQGYNSNPEWTVQMREYREAMSHLAMPWFPVAGNHDIYWRGPGKPPGEHEQDFEMNFGPLWYAFKHKNAGFIALFSDEGDFETGEKAIAPRSQKMSPQQLDFLKQALAKLSECKHVFVFLHHPRWFNEGAYEGTNWDEAHKLLVEAGNVSAVFGGHIHRMTYDGKKDGIEYLTLASVGAHLSRDLPQAGYLHQISVVTVRDDGIQMAAIPVGETIDPREFTRERVQEVTQLDSLKIERTSDPIRLSNQPAFGSYAVAIPNPTSRPIEVVIEAAPALGWSFLPDHQHFTIAPGERQISAFRYRFDPESASADLSNPTLAVQVEYLMESARVPLPRRLVPLDLEATQLVASDAKGSPREFHATGEGALAVASDAYDLPDGPFTLEAWVRAASLDDRQGVVAKTQSSEYAIFLHEGVPDFSVHLNGKYVSASADQKLALNRWTHIAGTFDGERITLFLDGKPTKTVPARGSRTRNRLPLYLGADPGDEGVMTSPFRGNLDEVRLSKVARYEGEFSPTPHFDTDDSTVLHFDFDDALGPFVIDDSKSGAVGRLRGTGHLVPEDRETHPMPATR